MKTKKNKNLLYRVQALALAVVMVLSLLLPATGLQVSAETTGKWTDSGNYTAEALSGTGTQEDPYKIASARDLAKLAQDTGLAKGNKFFVLTKDIDLSAHEWAPIAEFKGSLDGNGHCVTGLQIGTAAEPAGLVNGGLIATLSAGSVKNLSVQVSIHTKGMKGTAASDSHVGGIVGNLTGTLDNCAVYGSVMASSVSKNLYVGGLAGRVNGASVISNCANYADVRADSGATTGTHNTAVGGVAGCEYSSNTASVINCANYGEAVVTQGVKARSYEGGIVGRGMVATSPITNCYNGESVANTVNSNISHQKEIAAFGCTLTNCYYKNSEGTNCAVEDNSEVADILSALNANVSGIQGATSWSLDTAGNPVPLVNVGLPAATPKLKVEGAVKFGEKLTAVVTDAGDGVLNYQWFHASAVEGEGDTAIDGANAQEYTIQAADVGKTLICVVSGGSIDGSLREIVGVVAKAAGPDAPALTAVDASSQSAADGKITGTSTEMEYSNSSSFASAQDCPGEEVTGLVPGIYYVRVKETDTHEAGKATEVVVGPYVEKWTAEGNYTAGDLAGSGTQEDPYQITSAADLAKLAKDASLANAGKYFKVTTPTIDLSAHEWEPIYQFSGTLDGNGVVITGLKIGSSTAPAEYASAGFIGTIQPGATVRGIHADVAIYTRWGTAGTICAGGIAGFSRGVIDSCTVSGLVHATALGTDIKLDSYVGGIVGRARPQAATDSVVISNCINHADVTVNNDNFENGKTRYSKAGGVVGYMHSTIECGAVLVNCVNTGDITALGAGTNRAAAGIAGYVGNETKPTHPFTVFNCYSTGKVTALSAGNVAGAMGTVDAGGLYYMKEAGNAANTVDTSKAQELSKAEISSAAFVQTLDINACTVNERLGKNIAQKWMLSQESLVVPNGVPATDKALTVSVNSERYGSVKVEVQAPGSSEWVEMPLRSLLVEGSKVRLTMTAASGCLLDTLTVDGQAVQPDGNSYEFTIAKSMEAAVSYKAGPAVDVAPIYVNPTAAAGGDGRTPETALRTLEEAKTAITALLSEKINSNVTVYLMGGRYILDETLTLGEAQTSLGRVTFKAYNDERAVVTSAREIDGTFTKVSGKEYYSYQLPESSKVNGEYPEFRDLLINGERAILARTQDYLFLKSYKNQVITGGKVSSCENTLYVDPASLEGISNDNRGNVEIVSLVEWKSQLFHIADIKPVEGEQTEIILNGDEWTALGYDKTLKSLVGRVYWLQNHLNYLDEPGEFWYDHANGIIYYQPYADQNMATAKVEYPVLDILVNVDNGANFTFEGIEFTGTTANFVNKHGLVAELGATYYTYDGDPGTNVPCAAIWAEGAEGMKILSCRFQSLAGTGFLSNYGTKNLEVVGNVFKDLGISGVIVGVNQRQWNEFDLLGASENVTIANNYVTNIGIDVPCAPAIKVARSKDLKINHNTIIHVSYSAIMAGWGWNVNASSQLHNTNLINAEIAYNYIEDFIYGINDGGAIYTCGANGFTSDTEYFNFVHDNYIRAGAHSKTNIGIYHDGSTSNFHTYHNVIDNVKSTHGPIFFQDDVASQNSHNILAENNFTTVSEISTSAGADRNIVLKNNVMVADRSLLCDEAKAIIAAAGLESEYQHIADPMDTELRISDNSGRYTYKQFATDSCQGSVKLTNNSGITKTFTLSLADNLPDNFVCTLTGNDVTLAPGQSATITMTFTALDEDEVFDSGDTVIGFVVEDDTGRSVRYPRAFTFTSKQDSGAFELPDGSKKLAYGTPVLDGIMDEAYKQSYRMRFGNAFYPSTNSISDVSGYVCLLWDEQYLYVYAFVEDSTVMSRGMDVINTGDVNEIWATDALETYIFTDLQGEPGSSKLTKFAVDAFGICRFGNAVPNIEYHNTLPYVTAFTYNGEIVEGYKITEPTAGQYASTNEHPVNGYVIEMVLPLTEDSHIDGTPKAGDQIEFYAQNNDLQAMNGKDAVVVAKKNALTTFTLVKEDSLNVTVTGSAVDHGIAAYEVPEGGWKAGENTFTVTSEKACVVLITNDSGATYTRLTASGTGNTRSFTAQNVTADSKIVITVAGDVNEDGVLSVADVTKIVAVQLEKTQLTAQQSMIADTDNSGDLSVADVAKLKAAQLELAALSWDAN